MISSWVIPPNSLEHLTWTPRNHRPGSSLSKRLLNLGVPTSRKWNDVWISSAANMWRCDIRPGLCGTRRWVGFTIGPFAESERVSFVSLQVRRQGADPSKEPSVEGSSGCAVGSPPGPLMEADKEVVGLSLWWKNWGLDEDPFWIFCIWYFLIERFLNRACLWRWSF